jgi:hypothetical protein
MIAPESNSLDISTKCHWNPLSIFREETWLDRHCHFFDFVQNIHKYREGIPGFSYIQVRASQLLFKIYLLNIIPYPLLAMWAQILWISFLYHYSGSHDSDFGSFFVWLLCAGSRKQWCI